MIHDLLPLSLGLVLSPQRSCVPQGLKFYFAEMLPGSTPSTFSSPSGRTALLSFCSELLCPRERHPREGDAVDFGSCECIPGATSSCTSEGRQWRSQKSREEGHVKSQTVFMPKDQTESICFHGTHCISSVFSGERLLVYLKPGLNLFANV